VLGQAEGLVRYAGGGGGGGEGVAEVGRGRRVGPRQEEGFVAKRVAVVGR
jgi:hypothetical protein